MFAILGYFIKDSGVLFYFPPKELKSTQSESWVSNKYKDDLKRTFQVESK